ncbi:MAG: zinc ribbon domain-containing protein [Firmicutes bacterium]|nr:zinc ribbon domain-containing protein [Bacillota bacterium]
MWEKKLDEQLDKGKNLFLKAKNFIGDSIKNMETGEKINELNGEIEIYRTEKDKFYRYIGLEIYKKYKDGEFEAENSGCKNFFAEIEKLEEKIKSTESLISELSQKNSYNSLTEKNSCICPSCFGVIEDKTALFCPKCGAKLNMAKQIEAGKTECVCGNICDISLGFCVECGRKLQVRNCK